MLAARLLVLSLAAQILLWMYAASGFRAGGDLPRFSQDTVLVWKIENQDQASELVVRIALFLPSRYIEWENASTQGTIFMPAKAVSEARIFFNSRLFEAGTDTRGNNSTTLWLSERTFRELKANSRAKVALDTIDSWMTLLGTGHMPVLVNRSGMEVPIIKVADDRGSERWFLDLEDNPLMVKHLFRSFAQSLFSINTDRPNTLRWIKGKKLANPPR